jgi:hypothetical protein
VFENRVLRRTSGPNRVEVAGGCRRLHNAELHNLYTSPYITRVIKSRRVRWVRHVARMGSEKITEYFGWKNLKGRGHLEDLGVKGKVKLPLCFN